MSDDTVLALIVIVFFAFVWYLAGWHIGRAVILEEIVNNPSIVVEANKIVKDYKIDTDEAYIAAKSRLQYKIKNETTKAN